MPAPPAGDVADLLLDRPSAEREAFVADACRGDADLRAEVASRSRTRWSTHRPSTGAGSMASTVHRRTWCERTFFFLAFVPLWLAGPLDPWPRALAGGAQAQAPQTADAPRTSAIRGRVVATDTGAPISGATVRLVPATPPQRFSDLPVPAATDDEGRYEVRRLAPGRYEVIVNRDGYVPTRYGARSPLERGRAVTVAEGETADGIDFALPRFAVISGRVLDEYADPAVMMRVSLMRTTYLAGGPRLVELASAETDDLGEYRLYGIPPGRFVLSATLPSEAVLWRRPEASPTDPGPTYYPGVATLAQAKTIVVKGGEEMAGVEFAIAPVPRARISGTVFDSSGERRRAGVSLVDAGLDAIAPSHFRAVTLGPEGEFRLDGVVAGDYLLIATLGQGSSGGAEVVLERVSVAGVDVQDLVLQARPVAAVAGRIRTDGPRPTFSPTSLSVRARPVDPDFVPGLSGPASPARPARVNGDWSFHLPLLPVPALLQVTDLPPGWELKSILRKGRDVTDLPLDLRSGEVLRDFEVIITTQVTGVEGRIVGPGEEPVAEASVVVFSADRRRWLYGSRAVQVEAPDQHGRFRVTGLSPGDYSVVAVPPIEEQAWQDPLVLERLREIATTVTVEESALVRVTLKLTRLPVERAP